MVLRLGDFRSRSAQLFVLPATLAAFMACAPPSYARSIDAESLRKMRQELDALRTEEAVRAQRIDALARELARASGEPVIETLPEQPATAATGSRRDENSKFEIYGFAQADYIQDFDRVDPAWDAALRPSKIPTEKGVFGDDGDSILSVRQSRFGVQASQEIAGELLYAKFEFDLFGVGNDAGQTTFRLRHAYGSWGPLLAGQTNSLFMDGDTFPNTIEYWGPNGMVFLRNPQVRLTFKQGGASFAVAVEKPGNDIDAGAIRQVAPELGGAIRGTEKLPDLTAQVRYGDDWGHVQLAGILRKVGYETIGAPDNRPKNSKMGWGVNVSGNVKTWGKDVLHLSAVYGEGIASYMNDGGTDLGPKLVSGAGPPVTGVPAPPSLRGDVVPLLGLMVYYDHYWSDAWSTSLGWSMVDVDNTSFQSDDAFNRAQYASANLLYSPASRLMMGAELLWAERKDFDGAKGDDLRVQVSFKYSFSSNDDFK